MGEEKGFIEDIFNRKPLADKIVDLINISEEKGMRDESFVIALNASWGNGKTTFVNKLIDEIKGINGPKEEIYSKLNAIPIYYNAWEEDDYGNAFESLVFRIIEKIESHKNITPNMKKQLIILKSKLPDVLFSVGKSFVQNKLKKHDIEIEEIIDLVKINNELKKLSSNDYFEKYQKFKKIKNDFKEILDKLASEKKIIIFIDELDRCRPNFAIETLEIVKHYFDIPNIVFVLSLDIEQLSHSIATCYGQNMDSAGYLRRFIDFQVNMPQAKLNLELFKEFKNQSREVQEIINYFDLSLRDFYKIKKDILLFLYKMGMWNTIKEITQIYVNLILMKHLFPEKLRILLCDKFDINDYHEKINSAVFPWLMDYFLELKEDGNKTLLKEIPEDRKNKKWYFKIHKFKDYEESQKTLGQKISEIIEYVSIRDN